jgi:hypothetical protein
MIRASLLPGAILLGTTLLAQSVTVPAGLATPGNQSQTSNWRGPRRHQVVLDPRAVPPLTGAVQAIELRGDDVSAWGLPAQLDVTVLLSSVGVPLPSRVDPTSYSGNLGSDAVVLVNSARITTPTSPGAVLTLPFARPFAYRNGNPLLVQIEFVPVLTPTIDNPNWVLDAHALPDTFWQTSGATSGTACPVPGQWTVYGDPWRDQLVFRWGTAPGPQDLPAFVLFGLSDQTFGGLRLPFDLSPFGAPGCALRTSIDSIYPTTTRAGGGFSWVLVGAGVSRDARYTGMDMFAQALVLDPAANAAGLQFSELRRERLLVPPSPVLASHALGSFAPGFPNDAPEIVHRNRTLVFGLQ